MKNQGDLTCPVCSAPGVIENILKEVTLCRCPSCDHCFTDLHSIDQLEPYHADYFEEEHRNWFRHPNLQLYARLAQIILQHSPTSSVLDVGCGNGNFLRYLANLSETLTLTGIDIASNQPSRGITYLQGNFLEHEFGRKFDVVVSLAVIEHIPDVTALARRMRDLCTPGGLAINMTVDDHSLIYSSARFLGRAGYSVPMDRLYSKHHLNHFTTSSLKKLLESHELATVEVIRHNSPMAAIDLPKTSPSITAVLRSGVWIAFQIGELLRRTMLQTMISKRA